MSGNLTEAARRTLALIDLTSLNDAHDDDVAALCTQAQTDFGPVAAVCVWPEGVVEARRCLAESAVRIATVVNFPGGGTDIAATLKETAKALDDGADEIDLVMPYPAWLAGETGVAGDMIAAVKDGLGPDHVLKVILESGALGPVDKIAAASRDAVAAGADVLKTSTGKLQPAVTLEAAEAMLGVIKESDRAVGFKAAGGIRTVVQASAYLALADRIMGAAWVTPQTFRFGASGLLGDVLAVLRGEGGAAGDSDY